MSRPVVLPYGVPSVLDLRQQALAAVQAGDLTRALVTAQRAVVLAPDQGEIQATLATAHIHASDFTAALIALDRARRLGLDSVALHLNRAGVLLRLGRTLEAVADYDWVLVHEPNHPIAQARRASAALSIVPALQRRGAESLYQGLPVAAEAVSRQVVALYPDRPAGHNNLGIALIQQGRLAEAAQCFRHALRVQPDYAEGHSNLLFCLNYDLTVGDEALKAAHMDWDRVHRPASACPASCGGGSGDRLRIGYVSPNLNRHAVGWFLAGVLEHHDRQRFTVTVYDDGSPADDLNARLRAGADVWREVGADSIEDLRRRIAEDGIDILFDLAGHTSNNRLKLFAGRAAPLQIGWLGWFHTTGLEAMDAAVMDPHTVPEGGERWFTERVIRLPHSRFCYWPPPEAPEVAPLPMRREGRVTFGSFNNLAKLNPAVIAAWAAVLRAVPESRLVLKWKTLADETLRQRLSAAFLAEGIPQERLELRLRSPHRDMLAEYGDIDIALDPFPFTGGLTSCETLWMGVPVLTLLLSGAGARPVSRQTYAFLSNLGLAEEFAASSVADYVAKAVAWSRQPDALAALRRDLRPRMAASKLCDGGALMRALEDEIEMLYKRL